MHGIAAVARIPRAIVEFVRCVEMIDHRLHVHHVTRRFGKRHVPPIFDDLHDGDDVAASAPSDAVLVERFGRVTSVGNARVGCYVLPRKFHNLKKKGVSCVVFGSFEF